MRYFLVPALLLMHGFALASDSPARVVVGTHHFSP